MSRNLDRTQILLEDGAEALGKDAWGEDLASINEKALAKHREGIVGELSWLKEQHEAGHVSESVYLERQQDLLRPHRWGDKVRDKRENG